MEYCLIHLEYCKRRDNLLNDYRLYLESSLWNKVCRKFGRTRGRLTWSDEKLWDFLVKENQEAFYTEYYLGKRAEFFRNQNLNSQLCEHS